MSAFVEAKIKRGRSHPLGSSWSPEEYRALLERVEREAQAAKDSQNRAHSRAWELAKQQGVKPIQNVEEVKGNFWPEEESTDEFLSWLRKTRQDDEQRSIPK
jgi:hypothetical protein